MGNIGNRTSGTMGKTGWISVFFLAVGCAQGSDPDGAVVQEEHPVIGGSVDNGDPSVVALYGQKPGESNGFLCTGSVIAPTVILTAAHCVSPEETGVGARFTVIASPDIDQRDAKQLAVNAVHANPLWHADNLEGGHDQGIVILSQPTILRPLPINRKKLDSSLRSRPVRIVGYGLDDGTQQTGAGVKRQALTTLGSIFTNLILVGDSRRGTCNGDSGGPAFMNIGGIETIVGTTSYGNAECTDGGFDARVDADLAFIDRYLPVDCHPACDDRACGSDGCGGSCGECPGSAMCSDQGACVSAGGGCDKGGQEQEPNDSALLANALCAAGTSQGDVTTSGDADWFSWSVDANVIYTVTLTTDSPGLTVRVYKISTAGKLSFIGDGPTVARHTDLGGSYVARVATTGATGGRYSLNVKTMP